MNDAVKAEIQRDADRLSFEEVKAICTAVQETLDEEAQNMGEDYDEAVNEYVYWTAVLEVKVGRITTTADTLPD